MDNMQEFLHTHSTPSGAINWFDYFYGETIPKKRFKPFNHSKRKRRNNSYLLGWNMSYNDCIFDDDDMELVEDYIGHKSIWQQYDQ